MIEVEGILRIVTRGCLLGLQASVEDHSGTGTEWPSSPSSARKICLTCSSAVAGRLVVMSVGSNLVVLVVRRQIIYAHLRVHDVYLLLVFTASFGPGGFRTTGGRTHHHQHAQQNNERAEPRNVFLQLLPLFVLFFISFFSSLPSLFSSSPSQVPDPHFSFNPTQRYSVQRYTSKYGLAYWVDPKEFLSHPTIGSELAKNGETLTKWLDDLKQWKEWELREETADLKADQEAEAKAEKEKTKVVDPKNTPENRAVRRAVKAAMRRQQRVKSIARTSLPTLSRFEASVERIYSEELYAECRRVAERKERRKDAEVGIFGIGADWDKVRRIEAEAIESCEILRGLGILR